MFLLWNLELFYTKTLYFVKLMMKLNMQNIDYSQIQTAAGLSNLCDVPTGLSPTVKEKKILRDLALRVKELSSRPIEDEKKKLWTSHNDLKLVRPLVFCDPENGWNEIITQDQILCTDPLLRVWEMALRKEIFWGEEMQDDRVIEDVFYVPYFYKDTGYGLTEIKEQTDASGSFRYISPIKNYDEDFEKLMIPQIEVNEQNTLAIKNMAEELFGDILSVRLRGIWWWSLGMTWDYIKLRGLENLMLDMMLEPDWVHRMMDFLTQSVHSRLNYLETNHLLSLNTGGTYVGSGGFGWTKELPENLLQEQITTKDMWGFCESQETVGISPEMFAEFILPYQLTIMERFGLNCYGCCEPLDLRWKYICKIPRLRRVSVSPWANIPQMAEFLEDKYIMSIKPSPTSLAQPNIDETSIRKSLEDTLRETKGCHVELIMKDNHTLGNNPLNATRWCKIAKELVCNL